MSSAGSAPDANALTSRRIASTASGAELVARQHAFDARRPVERIRRIVRLGDAVAHDAKHVAGLQTHVALRGMRKSSTTQSGGPPPSVSRVIRSSPRRTSHGFS